jgi:hypothetical protein
MIFEEFKTKALALGHTNVQSDEDNAPVVPLKDWKGLWSGTSGGRPGMSQSVTYTIEGSRVRIRKALEEGDHWYTLS